MKKVNYFILKHTLGLDPYVLKQEKEKGSNSGIFFSIFTFTFLLIFFLILFLSIDAILNDLHFVLISIISFIAFLPFYNIFSFALISWRSHESFLNNKNKKKNKFSYYTSSFVTLLIRFIFLFLALGLFIGLSYTVINQQIVSQEIKEFKKNLIFDYQENLKQQIEIDKKIEAREYYNVLDEINKLEIKIANSTSKLDSLSYLSLKNPLVEKKQILKKEIESIEFKLLADYNLKQEKYKAEITKNQFFLKSLILLSKKASFLRYSVLISVIFGLFIFCFWWRFVRSNSTYFKIDNHLHRNAINLTSTPIIKSTIEYVKTKFDYDYKTDFPMEQEDVEDKTDSNIILGIEHFITKLRKNEL